jgi:hypothetical protein
MGRAKTQNKESSGEDGLSAAYLIIVISYKDHQLQHMGFPDVLDDTEIHQAQGNPLLLCH